MKKPEYVASVTRMYRKYVDLYLEKGREHYHVEEADILQLKDIYNRGGFTDGYYIRHNSKDMMSIDRPNHCGVAVGLITELNRQNIAVRITETLNKGDVLEFDVKNASFNYTLGRNSPYPEPFSGCTVPEGIRTAFHGSGKNKK